MRAIAALIATLVLAGVAASPPVAAQPAAATPGTGLPHVVILATGGTIAGTASSSTATVGYAVATVGVQALIAAVPELGRIAVVRGEQVLQIASENMTPQLWLKLGKRVAEVLAEPDVAGVVITHGTDTLEETAYFLDLTVHSDKPIVLVGAMRPATSISADGPMNLYEAVLVAASREAVGRGTLVCMDDEIDAAREVTKTNTTALDTFRTPVVGSLGVISGGRPVFYRSPARRHNTGSEFDVTALAELPRVDIVPAYAGAGRGAVDFAVSSGARGIVYAAVGDGSVPLDVRPAFAEARKKGVVVVRSSRVGSGAVVRNGEISDDEFDLVAADNLNPQKARILLMLALTRTSDTRVIQQIFWQY